MFGVRSLSDAELLAIFLGSGCQNVSAIDLGQELLSKYLTLEQILDLPFNELIKNKGINKVKAITLMAINELHKRSVISTKINALIQKKYDPETLFSYYQTLLGDLKQESLYLIALKRKRMIQTFELGRGQRNSVMVPPGEIIALLLKHDITEFVLLHNHPSGSTTPSLQDLVFTRHLKEEIKRFNLKLVDHLIITRDGYSLVTT